MLQVTLGQTGITVGKNGFGCLPIQRISEQEAVALLRRAYDGGITYFDTARAYSDSEKKVGLAFAGRRGEVFLASKTMAKTADAFRKDLETSLAQLSTDYIDVYQFHNPPFCPKPGDGTGLYEAMAEAKAKGKVRHIGITNHRMKVALEAIDSGLYETLQFPFSYLATDEEIALVRRCEQAGMGFVAMKGLAGGLLTNARAAWAFLSQFDGVLPIWGMQRECELDEFLSFRDNPPALDPALQAVIEQDRTMLSGEFCRGCGFCMPCPAGIQINTCARMSLMIRRSPSEKHLTPESQAMMKKIEGCLHCNQCKSKCPYGLDTPTLLARNYADYCEILAGKPV